MSDDHLHLCVRLHLAEGLGSVLFARLMETFGDVESFWAAGPGQWRKVRGVGPKLVEAIGAVDDSQVAQEFDEAERVGASILSAADERYPVALKNIHDPPPVLYVRGALEPTDAVAFAVVGSRCCTHYGLEQAERFGQLLGRAGFCVVSGGARGIDTAAHRGALAVGGRTIVVMGCGLSEAYPSENAALFDRIVDEGTGAVVSELPMRTAVKAGNFPTRNRIISGLSLGVLVVEAAPRSGSLITARLAAEQGRQVFALPGRVDSPLSQGANELIRDGVILTQRLDDILEHLGAVGAKMTVDETADDDSPPGELDETQGRLWDALAGAERSLDELVRQTSIPSGPAAAAMTILILRGLVEQRPGNVFTRKKRGGK